MFDAQGAGSPAAVGLPSPAAEGLIYFDKQNGVIYTLSAQGWTAVLESVQAGLTAHAGGGQANGTPITAQNAQFTTVATGGDSATLPTAIPGLNIAVSNATAATSMNVFPATGGQINGLGANAAFAVAGGKTAIFFAYTSTQWHAVLSA